MFHAIANTTISNELSKHFKMSFSNLTIDRIRVAMNLDDVIDVVSPVIPTSSKSIYINNCVSKFIMSIESVLKVHGENNGIVMRSLVEKVAEKINFYRDKDYNIRMTVEFPNDAQLVNAIYNGIKNNSYKKGEINMMRIEKITGSIDLNGMVSMRLLNRKGEFSSISLTDKCGRLIKVLTSDHESLDVYPNDTYTVTINNGEIKDLLLMVNGSGSSDIGNVVMLHDMEHGAVIFEPRKLYKTTKDFIISAIGEVTFMHMVLPNGNRVNKIMTKNQPMFVDKGTIFFVDNGNNLNVAIVNINPELLPHDIFGDDTDTQYRYTQMTRNNNTGESNKATVIKLMESALGNYCGLTDLTRMYDQFPEVHEILHDKIKLTNEGNPLFIINTIIENFSKIYRDALNNDILLPINNIYNAYIENLDLVVEDDCTVILRKGVDNREYGKEIFTVFIKATPSNITKEEKDEILSLSELATECIDRPFALRAYKNEEEFLNAIVNYLMFKTNLSEIKDTMTIPSMIGNICECFIIEYNRLCGKEYAYFSDRDILASTLNYTFDFDVDEVVAPNKAISIFKYTIDNDYDIITEFVDKMIAYDEFNNSLTDEKYIKFEDYKDIVKIAVNYYVDTLVDTEEDYISEPMVKNIINEVNVTMDSIARLIAYNKHLCMDVDAFTKMIVAYNLWRKLDTTSELLEFESGLKALGEVLSTNELATYRGYIN